jgi:DMSO/TMAO reductase YedYZ molybdopterin-dependent catalytic subunit
MGKKKRRPASRNSSRGTSPARQPAGLRRAASSSDMLQGVSAELVQDSIIAGLISVGTALLARLILNISTPAEIFGDRLTPLIPLPIFEHLLSFFGSSAKHIYFGGLLLVEGLVTAAAGVLYWYLRQRLVAHTPRIGRWLSPQDQLDFREVPVIVIIFWLVSAGLVAPIIGGGFFGLGLIGGWTNTLVSQFIPDIAFAVTFIILLRRRYLRPATATTQEQVAVTRRRLLQLTGLGALVIAGSALAWDVISGGAANLFGGGNPSQPPLKVGTVPKSIEVPTPSYGAWTPVAGLTPEVTSPANFYYVSKNLAGDPQIDTGSWRLQIGGMVKNPYTLTYDQLQALPQIQQYHTLECISNEVGGNLISNALFVGASLADILQTAGIKTGASELIFQAADSYSDALHLSQALDPQSLIVYLIDGVPLPQPHGYPARLLIPGLYGMKNCKWVTSLQVGSGSFTGYWEEQGWSSEAVVNTMTRIDVPQESDLLVAKPMFIAGIAYAGDRGISRVDVSTDGGQTWNTATLRRPLGNLTWVLWEYAWSPPGSNSYIIVARSVDGQGDVQQPQENPPLPDGSTGYDAIGVTVR